MGEHKEKGELIISHIFDFIGRKPGKKDCELRKGIVRREKRKELNYKLESRR